MLEMVARTPGSCKVFYTCVDEASRSSFAELLGLVGECDLHDPRDVSRGRLHPDSMRCDELEAIRAHVQWSALNTQALSPMLTQLMLTLKSDLLLKGHSYRF